MNNCRSIPFTLFFLVANLYLFAQNPITITDDDLQPNQNHVWTNDNTYLLDGLVYLEAGGTLEIEAGTIIRGLEQPSDDSQPFSALIIEPGATIVAKGDACNPIIFTSENDDFEEPITRGRWGGLVILGNAPASLGRDGEQNQFDGLDFGDHSATYGGNNPEDNSGVLLYVSIRQAGAVLPNESSLPGLTLAGVGSGTLVSFVEVFAAQEDGIALLGGAVNLKNIVAAYNGANSFFWDKGYQGFGQFWFAIHDPNSGASGGRHLGGQPSEAIPVSNPTIFNATFLGTGVNNTGSLQSDVAALHFSEKTAGNYSNSIIGDFSGFGLFLEDIGGSPDDSYGELQNGNLQLKSNLWVAIATMTTDGTPTFASLLQLQGGDDPTGSALISHLGNNNNLLRSDIDGLLNGISRTPNGGLDPRPVTLDIADVRTDEPVPSDPFFTPTTFKGAFGPDLWLQGWTALDFLGYLPACDLGVEPSFTNVTCFGANDGGINLEFTGNVSDLVIDWDVDQFDGLADLTDLAPGTYNVTVTNAECCERTATITINQPDAPLSVDCADIQDATDPVSNDGQATITALGGSGPVELLLTDANGNTRTFSFGESSSVTVNDLAVGDYNALVTDSNGCTNNCDFSIGSELDCVVIRDSDLLGGITYNWTADVCYLIEGLVFLEEGGVLNIEAGTLIKGRPNTFTEDPVSALIIARGASISANGTAENPIIFTAEIDDETAPTDLTAANRGLWGGLALLGDAPVPNAPDEGGDPIWEVLADFGGPIAYGGNATLSYSHLLQYISIRHAGASVSENRNFPALAFAGVRADATLDHLEVFASGERGITFYGGEAELAYASATFCQGPAFSWQDGYQGKGQFWFALADPGSTGLLAEHKGYYNPITQDTVSSAPSIFNATYIGGGGRRDTTAVAMRFSQASAGVYGNSIFTHFKGNALEVEDLPGDANDSQSLLTAENAFFLKNNLFWGFGAGDSISVDGGFLQTSAGAPDIDADFLVDHLIKNRNKAVNPRLKSVSNVPNRLLDPRPEECAAYFTRFVFPDSIFFDTSVYYKGAFGREDSLWIDTWTALSVQGYLPTNLERLNWNTCTMNLDSGFVFISEFIPEATPAFIEEVKGMHSQYARVLRECNCGEDSVSRLIMWETFIPTDITNCRAGAKDSTIIDTSGLKAMFDLGFEVVEEPSSGQYCGTVFPQTTPTQDSIVIAILDSGIDMQHFRLVNYPWINWDEEEGQEAFDDDENCMVDDKRGFNFLDSNPIIQDKDDHGTHLAGIITERFPTNLQPKLMNLKIYEKGKPVPGEEQRPSRGSVFDLICAIHYAINEGAEVINLSIGYWSPELSIPLYNAFKRAESEGIPVIVSTGNDGLNVDQRRLFVPKQSHPDTAVVYEDRWPVKYKMYGLSDPDFPNLNNLIGVSSVEQVADGSWDFPEYANYGMLTLDVSAKGSFYSTVPMNTFRTFQGTSMSAAYISRVISIARAYDPTLSIEEINNCLRNSIGIDNTRSQLQSDFALKRLIEQELLGCLGVTKSNQEIVDKPLPSGTNVLVNFNVMVCDEPLKITFGDGSTFYQEIRVVIKEPDGQGGFTQVHEIICQGSVIIWNTILNDGTELPLGDYFMDFYINGSKISSPGLRQFVKCAP
ncbi:MAG: S8 family serine peptidase [Saprospiraceae bacterium]